MSNENLYEYIQGEYQDVTRATMLPAGTEQVFIRDENRVKMAGYDIELWDEKTGGVQLVLDTDYQLAYLDATISGIEGVSVYGGYTIITPAYQDIDLYLTAKIVGGYTARPYRPTYTNITADYTTIPSSVDDSVFADTTAGPIALTMADGTYVNQRFSVIASGDNSVSITGAGQETASYINQAIQYVWNGTAWLNLGGAGSGGSSAGNLGIGQVAWFGGSGAIPADKLLCDGTEYNIVDYPGLFGSLGTVWGGDGITTFAVPNFQGIHPGAIGTQDINGRTKGDLNSVVGDYKEDQFQSHAHNMAISLGSIAQEEEGEAVGGFGSAEGTGSGYSLWNHNDIVTDRDSGARYFTATTPRNDDTNGDPRTGEFTDVSQAMGRWLIQAFDTVQEVPGDPGLVKDYNLVWEDTPAISIPNEWGGGLFFIAYSYDYRGAEVLSNAFMGVAIDGSDREIVIDVDQAGGDSEVRGKYVFATNSFDVIESGSDFSNPAIRAIFKWGDVATGELNPPVDGWEEVYPYTYTGTDAEIVNIWGIGEYTILLRTPANEELITFKVNLENLTKRTYATTFTAAGTSSSWIHCYYDPADNKFKLTATDSYTPAYFAQVKKFNSLVNVVHSYASTIEEIDTTAGDVAITLPDPVAAGTVRSYYNIGASGNHVTGLPDGIALGDGKGIQVTYGGTGWRYEDVCIDEYTNSTGIDGSSDYTKTTKKYASGAMEVTANLVAVSNWVHIMTYDEPFASITGYSCTALNSDGDVRIGFFVEMDLASGKFGIRRGDGITAVLPCSALVTGRWK